MTPPDDQSASDSELVDALVQASFVTMAVLSTVGAQNDLSLTQLRVLAILRDRRLRMSVLAEHLGLDRSTMTGLVDRAVARGLLERAASAEDGRAVKVFLSAGGAELAARLTGDVERALLPRFSHVAADERALLRDLLGSATIGLRSASG